MLSMSFPDAVSSVQLKNISPNKSKTQNVNANFVCVLQHFRTATVFAVHVACWPKICIELLGLIALKCVELVENRYKEISAGFYQLYSKFARKRAIAIGRK